MHRTSLGEFTWIDLAAKDLEAQSEFYEALFGWTHRDLPTTQGPIYRTFVLGESVVAGAAAMSPDFESRGMPTTWNLYIATPDLNEVVSRALDLGGNIFMPAMDVMDQGRMVGITDPTGGMVFFWQPQKHEGADLFFLPGSLIWTDLNTRDPQGAAQFFSALLGWEVRPGGGGEMPYWIVSVNDQPQGGIMPMPEELPTEVPAHWLVYFGVEDAEAAAEKARSLGATVEAGPMEAGGMSFAVLSDPLGAVFAIMTPMKQ